jgi:DNA-directed RNA polymerase specialized sigma24 family protein
MKRVCVPVPVLFPIAIPTDEHFLKQWYPWTAGKVARHFKRDKERCHDTAQNVRLRLLSKKFISRWFFKHLTDELVDRKQAEKILGGVFEDKKNKNPVLSFVGGVYPVYGHRSSLAGYGPDETKSPDPLVPDQHPNDTSVWLVSDLLAYAKFDYERYFYSIQNHTIDSPKVLRLLGYGSNDFSVLESLYRQGRIKPAELTDHQCIEVIRAIEKRGDECGVGECKSPHYSMGYCTNHYRLSRVQSCPACDHGREILRNRGLSLASRWNRPEVLDAVQKLRWNDTQLKPYLRSWRNQNIVKSTPDYIMRRSPKQGIDAGLLKYAEMVIDHEVVNDFKRMGRSDDLSTMVLKNPLSPEYGDAEIVAYDSDEKDKEDTNSIQRIIRDANAMGKFSQAEGIHDIRKLIEAASLTEEETDIIIDIDLGDMTVRQYAEKHGIPVARVHKILQSGHKKLQAQDLPESVSDDIAERIANKHNCLVSDIMGPKLFGPVVTARTELFSTLFDMGISIQSIASRFHTTDGRVSAAINRSVIQESRDSSG